MRKIEELISSMSIDELCGQVLCYNIPTNSNNIEEDIKSTKPGGIFLYGINPEKIKNFTDTINKGVKVPVVVATDVENGPGGGVLEGEYTALPMPMACGAADDEMLMEKAGIDTARICRKSGFHWTFSPVVDINYNPDNPVTNIRAVSDSPKQVVKIAGAYMRGLQCEGNMAATCKHFPGDGMDDRNQHLCTTVNSMSKDEWMNTYGYVYKEMFKQNVAAVMIGHISLPAYQSEDECDKVTGYKPATLSYNLITKLLKEELGFNGCVVSDAMSMIGVAAVTAKKDLAVEFINAGGDMILFAEPEDFDHLKKAVLGGRISMSRLKDAVRKVLELKEKVGLLDDMPKAVKEPECIEETALKIAEKSISIIRNTENILPLNINKGDNILLCNITEKEAGPDIVPFDTLKQEFEKRGINVTVIENQGHREIKKLIDEKSPYCVLVNSRLSANECNGGSGRLNFRQMMCFWRGCIFNNPRVVFTSFGDPYKIHEVPFMRTYVNAYSSTVEMQKAFVKVILGEIEAKGKSPVDFPGYFKHEV